MEPDIDLRLIIDATPPDRLTARLIYWMMSECGYDTDPGEMLAKPTAGLNEDCIEALHSRGEKRRGYVSCTLSDTLTATEAAAVEFEVWSLILEADWRDGADPEWVTSSPCWRKHLV